MAQCIGKTKSGDRCKRKAIDGKRCCLAHDKSARQRLVGKKGGRPRTPIDELSESYLRSGRRYTRSFGRVDADRFEEILLDPELWSLRSSFATIEMFKLEKLEAVYGPDQNRVQWGLAAQYFALQNEAYEQEDTASFKLNNEQLGKVIKGGIESERAKREFVAMTETQARIQQAEVKRFVALDGVFTARDVNDLMEWIALCATRVFTNATEVERFIEEVNRQGPGFGGAGALGPRKQSA